MATYRRELALDDATLTDLAIAEAESGLPRRLGLNWDTGAATLAMSPVHYFRRDASIGYVAPVDSGPSPIVLPGGYYSGTTVPPLVKPADDTSVGWVQGGGGGSVPPQAYANQDLDFGPGAPMSISMMIKAYNMNAAGNIAGTGPNYAGGPLRGWLLYAMPVGNAIRFHFYEDAPTIIAWAEFTMPWTWSPPRNVWDHLIFTYDGGTTCSGIRCWLNGVELSQAQNSGAATLTQGLQHPTYGFSLFSGPDAFGNLGFPWAEGAEFAVWDRELTAGEIATLAAGGKASFGTAHWDVNLPGATTLRDVVVPGDGADFSSTIRRSHQTKVNLITSPSGRVDNLRPNVDQNLAVDSAILGVEVELYASSPEVPADPWVGGPNGEGPVVIYEAADPDAVQVSFAPLTIQRPGILAAAQVRSGILAADTQPAVIIEGD